LPRDRAGELENCTCADPHAPGAPDLSSHASEHVSCGRLVVGKSTGAKVGKGVGGWHGGLLGGYSWPYGWLWQWDRSRISSWKAGAVTGLRVEGGAINGVGRDETIGNWALDPISSSVGVVAKVWSVVWKLLAGLSLYSTCGGLSWTDRLLRSTPVHCTTVLRTYY
jgi:hypothetical protein